MQRKEVAPRQCRSHPSRAKCFQLGYPELPSCGIGPLNQSWCNSSDDVRSLIGWHLARFVGCVVFCNGTAAVLRTPPFSGGPASTGFCALLPCAALLTQDNTPE